MYGTKYSSNGLKTDYGMKETDPLDFAIANEKDPFRKSLLEEKKKAKNEEFKQKIEDMKVKADELGLDPLDYYDKLSKGEIKEPTQNQPSQGGGIFSTISDFISKVTGASEVEQARNDAIKSAEDSQSQIADIYQKTQLLYANTQDPVEKKRLEDRLKGFENTFAQVEEIKQTSMQPGWAENLVKHPLGATTDFMIGTTKSVVGEAADVVMGKPLPPEAMNRSLAQNIARASMASLEILTLGFGKKAVQKSLVKTGMADSLKVGLEKMAGKDGLAIAGEILGEQGAKKITQEFVKQSLAEKIATLAAKSTTKEAFVKEVGKEVAKTSLKALGSKTSLEAASMGAAFTAGAAVESGVTDPIEISKEALKGIIIGYALERGLTGFIKAGSAVHGAEKQVAIKAETAARLDSKMTFKERLSARKESYTPEAVKSYKENKAKVIKAEPSNVSVSEAMKKAGVSTTKNDAIVRLQEEKMAIQAERKAPVTQNKSLSIYKEQKGGAVATTKETPKKISYQESFQKLGVEDFDIQKARKNYVRQMNEAMNAEEKGVAGATTKRQEIQSAWDNLKSEYKPSLAEKIVDKKLSAKMERIETVKDVRTLKAAKADLFKNEEAYIKKGISKEQIATHESNLSKAIDRLKEKKAVVSSPKEMTIQEARKENKRIMSKETLTDADRSKLNEVNARIRELESAPKEVRKEGVSNVSADSKKLKEEFKKAKTPEEKKVVMRKIQENVKAKMKESASKKEVLDIPEPTPEEIMALENEMESGVEYSMKVGGVSIKNKFDLGIFKNAKDNGTAPYSFSQLSEDASNIFKEAYKKLTGNNLEFKIGKTSVKNAAGEAKHQWNVARTEKNDIWTKTHEWAHFVTRKEAGFDATKVLSKEAQSEVMTWYKITHPNMELKLREAVAEGIAYMTKSPDAAFYYLRRFGADIQNNASKEIVSAMNDVNKLVVRLEELDPISAISGLQKDILYHEPKTGVLQTAKEAGLWVLSKVYNTMPLYGHKLLPAELRQIEYSLNHGALNPYYAGTMKLEGKSKEAFLKFNKLPADYKSWEELQAIWRSEAKKNPAFKGMSQKEISDKINTEVGNYMLAKHSLERKNLIGIAETKELEMAKANEIIAKMDIESPWAKEASKQVSDWWKKTTDSIQDRFSSVLTPNQRMILKQKLGYEYYVPVIRRETKGLSSFKLSKGGTGAIYPAMENYVAKLDKILSDAANRRAKETFIKSAEKAIKRGDNIGLEDVTSKISESKKQELYDSANEIFGMTEEDLIQAKRDGTLSKALSGVKDVYNGDKFMPENLMYAVVDGKERVFEIDPLIGNMFKSSYNPYWAAATASFGDRAEAVRRLVESKFQQNKSAGRVVGNAMFTLVKPFTLANKVARYGIIHNPVFMINNAARDFAESLKRTDESMSAFSVAYMKDTLQRVFKPLMGENTKDMLKEVDALYELAKSKDSLYMRAIGDGRSTSLRGAYSELYFKGFNWKKFGNSIENITEITESRARKTTLRIELEKEYAKGLKLGDIEENKLIEIIQKANEISVDWSAHGDLSKYLSLAPFGRATATGTAADLKFFIEKPSQYIVRTGATILPLTIGVYALNNRNSDVSKVWKSIDPQQKETYWFFILGKKTDGSYSIMKVAKPKSIGGTVVSNVEFALDRFKDIDPQRGYYLSSALYDSVFGGGSNLLKQGFGLDYSSYLNPLEASAIEQKTNKKTYWGTDIVSPYFQTKEPVAQQNEFTSWFAKNLGELTNSSPMIIDNYMKNITGTLGSQYLSETSQVKGGNPAKGLVNMFNKKIVETSTSIQEPTGYNSTEVKNFYSEYDKIKKKYDSAKQYSLSDQVKLRKYESAYSDTKGALSDYYDQIRKLRANKNVSDEEKTQKMNALNKKMTEKIRQFNNTPARKEFLKSGVSLRIKN